jgi:hypothetical protein
MEHASNTKQKESSAVWASEKDSCTEAPEGATGQVSVMSLTGGTPLIEGEHLSESQSVGHLEGLTEKVGSLGLQKPKKNHCGSARKRAGKTRRLEAPTGATAGGQPQTTSGEPQKLQGPSISAAKGVGAPSAEPESPEGEVPTHAQKRQQLASGTPGGGQAKRPNRLGNLAMPGPPRRAFGWQL